jgi:hypothetical protein
MHREIGNIEQNKTGIDNSQDSANVIFKINFKSPHPWLFEPPPLQFWRGGRKSIASFYVKEWITGSFCLLNYPLLEERAG